jgi:hypothetical protein
MPCALGQRQSALVPMQSDVRCVGKRGSSDVGKREDRVIIRSLPDLDFRNKELHRLVYIIYIIRTQIELKNPLVNW